MSDPRLVDMEPGGESTQYGLPVPHQPLLTNGSNRYESIRLFTESPSKQTGQLGGKTPLERMIRECVVDEY